MKKNLCLATLLASLCFGQTAVAGLWTETGDAGDTPGTAQHLIGTGALNTITGTMNDSGRDTDVFRIYVSDPATFSITMTGTLLDVDNDTILYVLDDNANLVFVNDDGGPDYLSQLNPGAFASHLAGFYLVAYNVFESYIVDDNGDQFSPSVLPPLPFHVAGWYTTEDFPDTGAVQLNFTGARFDAPPAPPPISVPAPASFTLTLLGLVGFSLSKRYASI